MIRIALYTNTVSPHQLPLAKELAKKVGDSNFRYIYTDVADKDHGAFGWTLDVPNWCIYAGCSEADEWLENADVLLSGLRCFDLFERRAKKDLKNFYMTERWFKPPLGVWRLLHPKYFGYSRRLCRLLESDSVVGLPIGIHAACDMARLCGLLHGDLKCLFRAPRLDFERMPFGRIWLKNGGNATKYCLDKMRMWGYFVEAGKGKREERRDESQTRVLWVGRMLGWKRVDTIIRAVGEVAACSTCSTRINIALDIYGAGTEEMRLKKMAAKYGDAIKFYPPVPIDQVRKLMREHDVYVLASNAYEGWGAVVSEALEEGMKVIGTYEAGSSATILTYEGLFHAGDCKRLMKLFGEKMQTVGVGEWSAKSAAEVIDA